MVSIDNSRSNNRQYAYELRVSSDFTNGINFNVGANHINFKSNDDYYVFNNLFTLIADWFYSKRFNQNNLLPCENGIEARECPYVDRNSLSNIDNDGHNYFLSQNGVSIKSSGIFGEVYIDPAIS